MKTILPYVIDLLKWIIEYIENYINKTPSAAASPEQKPNILNSPVKGLETLTITGAYPKYTTGKRHTGIDFACKKGQEFISISAGKVMYIKTGKRGVPGASTVKIKTGNTFIIYKHCTPLVKKGETVKPGQVLGTADLSGNTTGYHLHFETRSIKTGRTIEPLTVLKKYQPKLKYKIMGGKWHYPVKAVFENYNKKGLDIIEGRV